MWYVLITRFTPTRRGAEDWLRDWELGSVLKGFRSGFMALIGLLFYIVDMNRRDARAAVVRFDNLTS